MLLAIGRPAKRSLRKIVDLGLVSGVNLLGFSPGEGQVTEALLVLVDAGDNGRVAGVDGPQDVRIVGEVELARQSHCATCQPSVSHRRRSLWSAAALRLPPAASRPMVPKRNSRSRPVLTGREREALDLLNTYQPDFLYLRTYSRFGILVGQQLA